MEEDTSGNLTNNEIMEEDTSGNLTNNEIMLIKMNENFDIDAKIDYELIGYSYNGKYKTDFCDLLYTIENSKQDKEKTINMLAILINITNKVNVSNSQISIKEMLNLKLQEESSNLTKLRDIEMKIEEGEGIPIVIDSLVHLVNSGINLNSAIKSRGAISVDEKIVEKLNILKNRHIEKITEHMEKKLGCEFNNLHESIDNKSGKIDNLKNLTKEQLIKFDNYSIFKENEKEKIYSFKTVSEYLESGNNQRSFGIDLNDIDFGIKSRLPIPPIYLKNKTIDLKNSINEILIWTPLLNIPVHTSNLLILLSGTPMPMIMDSFTILRCYMVFFEIFYQDMNTSRKVDKIITYFTNEFGFKRLKYKDFKLLLDNVIFKEEEEEENLKNLLLSNFHQLTMNDFLSLSEKIKEIKTFKHECFENTYFREDLLEEFTNRKKELIELFFTGLEEHCLLQFFSCMNYLENRELIKVNYFGFLEKLQLFTLIYLQTYEIYIMKLLENASNNPCFPETKWPEFWSQKNDIHHHLINEEMVNNSKSLRSEIAFIRNKFVYHSGEINENNINKPIKTEEFDIDFSDNNFIGLYPNVQDIIDYANFLVYDTKDWELFRLDAINVKTIFEDMNKDQLKYENTEEDESTEMNF